MAYYEKESDNNYYTYFQYNDDEEVDFVVETHFHKSSELIIMTSGEYFVAVGDNKRVIKEGEIVFVNGLIPHHYKSIAKSKRFVLVLDDKIIKNISNVEGEDYALPTFMEKCDRFGEIKDMLQSAWQKWKNCDKVSRWAIMNKITALIVECYGLKKIEKKKNDNIMIAIIDYIENNYDKDLSLKDLADKFGYTEKYFSKLFNGYMGMGIREYINRYRIKQAEKIKSEQNIPVCKIAQVVGFDSLNTYYRAYNRYHGIKE